MKITKKDLKNLNESLKRWIKLTESFLDDVDNEQQDIEKQKPVEIKPSLTMKYKDGNVDKKIEFTYSDHYLTDNARREAAIKSIGGDGNYIVAKYYWEKYHSEGAEWHWITDNGIIIVTNLVKNDGRMICTKLIARPDQLRRYMRSGKRNELTPKTQQMRNYLIPQFIINKAIQHEKLGLNYA